jgi:hypothetical protein
VNHWVQSEAQRADTWRYLDELQLDFALHQEAVPPPMHASENDAAWSLSDHCPVVFEINVLALAPTPPSHHTSLAQNSEEV